jgi:hypothetical protein
LLDGDVVQQMRKLKEQPGQDLLIYGSDHCVALMQHDLIDEYRVMLYPLALSTGSASSETERARRPSGAST